MIALVLLVWSCVRCDGACNHLLELGCHSGAVELERARCLRACVTSPSLPVACVRSAASCEEAAQCGGEK